MLSFITIFTCVVLIDSLVVGTNACTCMPAHPQAAYCRSDFVIKATVISDRQEKRMKGSEMFEKLGIPVPVFVHYDVLVRKVYKGLSKIANVTGVEDAFLFKKPVPVHTSLSGAQCGVSLTKDTKYIIMGRIVGKRLQINHCTFLKEYKLVSKTIRHGLKGKYNCDCQVNTCIGGYCDREGGCQWNIGWGTPVDECIQKHRFCQKVQNPVNANLFQCGWNVENAAFKRCKKTRIVDLLYS